MHIVRHQSPESPPSAPEVRAQLQRLRDSSMFAASPTLCRLLEYVVEHWLRNDRVAPKEYTVGVEVFHRGEGFDPRFDTIVRAHARRLRERLAQYYLGEGRGDAIRIDMPKGHYVVQVQRVPLSAAAAPRQPGALPVPRYPLAGRQLDLATALEALSSPAARLLTLIGPGGVGKTRLAAEAVRRAGATFPGGLIRLDLSAQGTAEDAMRAVAAALGFSGGADAAQRALKPADGGAAVLLVLDNFEHLLVRFPGSAR